MLDLIPVEDAAKLMGMSLPRLILILQSDEGKKMLPASSPRMRRILEYMEQSMLNPGGVDNSLLQQDIGRGDRAYDGLYRCDVESYMKDKCIGIYNDEELAAAKQRIAELEEKLANSVNCDGHGVLSVIINMRKDKNDESSIAEFLKQKKLSISQIGVLLHPDPLHVGQEAISSHAKRLLPKKIKRNCTTLHHVES